jgi:hypothetical protein
MQAAWEGLRSVVLDGVAPLQTAGQPVVAEEAAVYERTGFADTFALCGVGSRLDRRITGEQRGRGFPVADMARLDLPPFRQEGQGDYGESDRFRR